MPGAQAEAHPPGPALRLWRSGAPHQRRDHAAAPQQAPRRICQQPERGGGEVQGGAGKRFVYPQPADEMGASLS